MKKIGLTFFSALLFLTSALGQQIMPKDIPTPQAASLGVYGNIPVSYFTGKANISIPLYSFTFRDVTLPITLSYDCGGVQLNSLPGWTGHNWTLSAGGSITRVVQGRYDEYIYPYGAHLSYPAYNYFQSYGAINRLLSQTTNNYKSLRDSVLNGTVDLAPDIFYFNFMGITGHFFLGNDGEWKVVCNRDIDVVFNFRDNSNYIEPFISEFPYNYAVDSQPKTIKGFMLRDDYGNKYYFGGNTDAIEYRTDFFRMAESECFASWIANTWYLTKVTDRHNNILYTFEYERGRFMAQVINSVETVKVGNSQEWVHRSYGNSYMSSSYSYPYHIEINAPVYLSKITLADDSYLTFFFSNINRTTEKFYTSYYNTNKPNVLQQIRPNHTNGLLYYYLQTNKSEIAQYQATATYAEKINDPLIATGISILRKICLNGGKDGVYNYYLQYNMDNYPMLTAVKMMNEAIHYNTNASMGTYTLKYDRLDLLPEDHLTRAVDHWGFFNGTPYSYPSLTSPDFTTFKSQRDPNPYYAQLGLLQEIIYPTGGASVFEYESNDFSKCQAIDRQTLRDTIGVGGGMRVKSIMNYEDSTHTKLLESRTFCYNIPGTMISSGQLYAPPVYYWPNWTPCDTYGGYSVHQSYFRTTSIVPLSNSFNPYVGYSYVEETKTDGTKERYHFTNFSDFRDQRPILDFNNGQPSPFDMFGERDYGRGKMKYKEILNNEGERLEMTRYWYNTVYEQNWHVFTSNLTYENTGNSGSFAHYNGGVYKLFYPRCYPIQESVTRYFGTDSIVDTKTYSISPSQLVVNSGNYSHTVNIYQLNTEYNYRNGIPTESIYYHYPNGSNDPLTSQLATIQFCLPIISYEKRIEGAASAYDRQRTEYGLFGGKILPKYQLGTNGGTQLDTLVRYLAYTPNGKLQKYKEAGKPMITLSWSNNDNYLLSKRLGTNVTTYYYYDNLWRLTSVKHPNNYIYYYYYDDFGRLIEIKDMDYNLISEFSYNYKNK